MSLKTISLLALIFGAKTLFAFQGAKLPLDLPLGGYKHFKVDDKLKKLADLSDLVELEVENTGEQTAVFFLVFEDKNSADYWSRLNFKTTLAPGMNKLSFELDRKLGQRGSIKNNRSLDFTSLEDMYVVVDPERVSKAKGRFILKQVAFKNNKNLAVPKGALFYDFAGSEAKALDAPGFKKISEKTIYKKGRGHGFSTIDLWRARDAQAAPALLSSSLSVKTAAFRVDIPNGHYGYELIWDELGYWEPPFWGQRFFSINGAPILKETRSSIRDYLRDYLALVPEPPAGSKAFSFYHKKTFKPVKGSFEVKDGKAIFAFEGDETGASLNSLLIWPIAQSQEAREFKQNLWSRMEREFSRRHRLVTPREKPKKLLKATLPRQPDKFLAGKACEGKATGTITRAKNGFAAFDICLQVKDATPVTYTVEAFEAKGQKIAVEKHKLSLYLYRAKSIDLNHETYEYRADQLEPLKHPSIELNGYRTRYLNLYLDLKEIPVGEYTGKIHFQQGKEKASVTIKLRTLDALYPKLPVKAGVIGLSPFGHTYFNSSDKEDYELRFHKNALSWLKLAGFNLFTDLPSPKIAYKGALKKKFVLESSRFDEISSKIEGDEIFSYGGRFPKTLFSGHQRNAGQSEEAFWKNLSDELEKLKKSHPDKKFVYLYSDEATGYRNAVDEDLKTLKRYREIFPSMKFGGFGNLHTWEKGKKLYKEWDYGLYSEIPSEADLKMLKRKGQKTGVYNICAEPGADLTFCFGPMLYSLSTNGVERYFEWHAAAIHNYPGFDLDGRESDVAFFYPNVDGSVAVTKRYMSAASGLDGAKKFFLLEGYLKSRKAPGALERKASAWLKKIKSRKVFPIKEYRRFYGGTLARDLDTLDSFLQRIFSK